MDYGCNICNNRVRYSEVTWVTSSYGICEECYNAVNKEDLQRMEEEYE